MPAADSGLAALVLRHGKSGGSVLEEAFVVNQSLVLLINFF
jgi:hypothetical protein